MTADEHTVRELVQHLQDAWNAADHAGFAAPLPKTVRPSTFIAARSTDAWQYRTCIGHFRGYVQRQSQQFTVQKVRFPPIAIRLTDT